VEAEPRIRVLVVDDDLFVRESLSDYLATAPEVELVGVCHNGAEAVAAVNTAPPPDVVLMDIRMPITDGIHATRLIAESAPSVKVVALTSFGDDESIASMLAAGAVGYLLKNTRPSALVDAVRVAHRGLMIVPAAAVGRWAAGRASQTEVQLSEREMQVLDLLADGLSNRQISQAMFLSTSTIKNEVAVLMDKFGVRSRTHVVARAHELGLLTFR